MLEFDIEFGRHRLELLHGVCFLTLCYRDIEGILFAWGRAVDHSAAILDVHAQVYTHELLFVAAITEGPLEADELLWGQLAGLLLDRRDGLTIILINRFVQYLGFILLLV